MNLSRRNFLKRAGGVTVAAAVTPAVLLKQPREALAEQRIPDYEPPKLADDPLNQEIPTDYGMMPVSTVIDFYQMGIYTQDQALCMLGIDPDDERNSIFADYARRLVVQMGLPE